MKQLIVLLLAFFSSQILIAQSTFDEFGDSTRTWLEERVSNAQQFIHEHVEVPFVVRSTGWGCMCPDYFIGINPGMQEGPFIGAVPSTGFPTVDSTGASLIVVGYFTGKIVDIDLRNEDLEPEEWLYHVPEFMIISWRKNELGYDAIAPHVVN